MEKVNENLSLRELILSFQIRSNKVKENYISKHFPNEYIEIVNYPLNLENNNQTWLGKIYNYVNNLKEIPKCEICGTNLPIDYMRNGYSKCNSINCPRNNINVNDFIKEELREWFTTDNESGCKSTENWLGKHYPNLHKIIIENCEEANLIFPAKIALYLNDLVESPKCIICGSKCKYHKSMKYTFGHYCGNKCWMNSNEIKKIAENNIPNKIKEMSLCESINFKNNNGLRSTENYIKNSHPDDYNKIVEYSKKFNEDISWGEKLYLYLNNLSKIPCCLNCGESVEFFNFRAGYREFCSGSCSVNSPQTQLKRHNTLHNGDYENKLVVSREKFKQTNIEKYGYEYPMQNIEVQNKLKKTNMERYGFEYAIQNEQIKEKIKQTCWEKYGCENSAQNEEIKNKLKETNVIKYGVEYIAQNKEIREKIKKTNLERYGVECIFSDPKIREKIKKTNIEKYGCENPMQNKEVNDKAKKTNIEKYGCEHAMQNEEIKNRTKETNLKRYGVEYVMQDATFIENARTIMIKKYGEIWVNQIPHYNPNSIIYLDLISEKLNIVIQHALNGGEKKFIKYFIDGYIEKYNSCIEWDENQHYELKHIEKDLIRENFIKENFNCRFIRINQKQFLLDVENQIEIVVDKIREIIKNN